MFEFSQRGCRGCGFLLGQRQLVLGCGQIGRGGFQHLPVGIALGLKRGQAMTSLGQFRFGRGRANHQLGTPFVVMTAASAGAIDFQIDLVQAIAIFAQFRLDHIAAFGTIAVLRLELLHGFGAVPHVFGEGVELGVEFGALLLDHGKLAGQNRAQLGAHLFAQLRIALGLGGLALQ